MAGIKKIISGGQAGADPVQGNPVKVVLGNKETMLDDMIEVAVRQAHGNINFQFGAAARVADFIHLAAKPESRLAMFIPPGNMDSDPGISCATPEEEAIRIIRAIKAKNPIPIIVMAVQSEARGALHAAGADVFLDMPSRLQEIVDAVSKCLGLEPKRLLPL